MRRSLKTEKQYCLDNNLSRPQQCKKCGKILKFRSFKKGYGIYCSSKCSNSSKEVIEKKKKTKKIHFGNENYNNTDSRKKTNFIKYGNTYGNVEKIKKTWDEKDKKEFSKTVKSWWGNKSKNEKEKRQNKIENTKELKYNNRYYNNPKKTKNTKYSRYGNENFNNTNKMMLTKMESGIFGYQGYKGNYQGIHYDSTWELAFIKFCLKNNIEIERNKSGFVYWFEDKKHQYYPDFYLPEVDQFVEIKADWLFNEQTREKIKQFSYKLDVYNKERITPILKEIR